MPQWLHFVSCYRMFFVPLIIYRILSLQPFIRNVHEEPERSSPPTGIVDDVRSCRGQLDLTEEKVTDLDIFLSKFL